MPIVPISNGRNWTNYHGTGTAQRSPRYALRCGDAERGRDELAIAGRDVRGWLGEAQAAGRRVRVLGSGWSPSNINIVDDGWLLHTRRFNRIFALDAADVLPHRDADHLLLVEAGALVDEVSDKLEARGRSLWTAGAGNGQTLAGACATGTHGSMTARGGVQDHVIAVQLVTPAGIYWIEGLDGVLTEDFVAATGSTLIRDDDVLAAVRLAVGAMGVITALVVDSVPRFLVRPIQNLRVVDRAAIQWLAAGEYRRFSARYAIDAEPDFLQVILNPYRPFKRPAMLRFLYAEPWRSDYPPASLGVVSAGYDALSILGRQLANFPWARGALLQFAMNQGYANGPDVDDPAVFATFGDTLDTHRPLADLYNASVTVQRSDLVRALDIATDTYARAGGSTVMTLRFMTRATGMLTPAKFAHNAVIDFDGPRSAQTEAAYAKVVAALDGAGIRFTRHWAKSCRLDAARVEQDYGHALTRFKAARDRLNPDPADRALFRSAVLDSLGLTI